MFTFLSVLWYLLDPNNLLMKSILGVKPDILAAILGMAGSTFNMNLSYRLQIIGLILWFIADCLIIFWAWELSVWIVLLNCYYLFTCSVGVWKRWKKPGGKTIS